MWFMDGQNGVSYVLAFAEAEMICMDGAAVQ
jgi:hypothetical protein